MRNITFDKRTGLTSCLNYVAKYYSHLLDFRLAAPPLVSPRFSSRHEEALRWVTEFDCVDLFLGWNGGVLYRISGLVLRMKNLNSLCRRIISCRRWYSHQNVGWRLECKKEISTSASWTCCDVPHCFLITDLDTETLNLCPYTPSS